MTTSVTDRANWEILVPTEHCARAETLVDMLRRMPEREYARLTAADVSLWLRLLCAGHSLEPRRDGSLAVVFSRRNMANRADDDAEDEHNDK